MSKMIVWKLGRVIGRFGLRAWQLLVISFPRRIQSPNGFCLKISLDRFVILRIYGLSYDCCLLPISALATSTCCPWPCVVLFQWICEVQRSTKLQKIPIELMATKDFPDTQQQSIPSKASHQN